MERRPRPDLEIRLEEHGALVDADLAAAPVNRIGRIGVDEGAGRDELGLVSFAQLVRGRRRRKHERIDEEAERDAETGPEHAADQEDRKPAPEPAHHAVPINPPSAAAAW